MKQESKKDTLGALLTGFGDVIGLPITILNNLTSFLFIQMLLDIVSYCYCHKTEKVSKELMLL